MSNENLPFSLYGNTYFEHLREFRDRALVESNLYGQRRRIGNFTFGIAQAEWQTEDGSTAHLLEGGLRYKSTNVTNPLPTTLRIYNHSGGDVGLELITFKMDIDDVYHIDIYHNLITSGSFQELAKGELSRRRERQHSLATPTTEQREYVYTELSRGATGLYRVTYDWE